MIMEIKYDNDYLNNISSISQYFLSEFKIFKVYKWSFGIESLIRLFERN